MSLPELKPEWREMLHASKNDYAVHRCCGGEVGGRDADVVFCHKCDRVMERQEEIFEPLELSLRDNANLIVGELIRVMDELEVVVAAAEEVVKDGQYQLASDMLLSAIGRKP